MRQYRYCAKGGEPMELAPGRFVCDLHAGPGQYSHCAMCGKEWDEGPGSCWVCWDDIARVP